MTIFDERESEVRSYCRAWPATFDRANGSWLFDEAGRAYLDFFSGAGALNYGHNDPALKAAVVDYFCTDRVVHSLDMFTVAKRDFLTTFTETVLEPRDLDYRVQFPGPGGANAVEAALKLARKVTGRTEILCFSNGFHGVSLGALAVTGDEYFRAAAGVPLEHTIQIPFDDGEGAPDFGWLEKVIADGGTAPAAVILETVQGEGGVNVARFDWLHELADRCRRTGVLLIVDDVQMGCGRTGPFFSFEPAGIVPDIVCLSKSIGGYGMPLALTLMRPELDVWKPGEHNGTFRGVDPALVAATAALRTYWRDDAFERRTLGLGERTSRALERIAAAAPEGLIAVRGRGMVHALAFPSSKEATAVRAAAFERGLLVETAGTGNQVVKLLPALTIDEGDLDDGLERLAQAVAATV